MRRYIVCGGREWGAKGPILRELKRLKRRHGDFLIIEGGAPGADTLAKIVGQELDLHVCEVKALWSTRHRGAGPQRNQAMLELVPNGVLAFHEQISKSKGTKDMVSRARKAGVEVRVFDS